MGLQDAPRDFGDATLKPALAGWESGWLVYVEAKIDTKNPVQAKIEKSVKSCTIFCFCSEIPKPWALPNFLCYPGPRPPAILASSQSAGPLTGQARYPAKPPAS